MKGSAVRRKAFLINRVDLPQGRVARVYVLGQGLFTVPLAVIPPRVRAGQYFEFSLRQLNPFVFGFELATGEEMLLVNYAALDAGAAPHPVTFKEAVG